MAMFNPQDEEDEEYQSLYDNGHWEWSDVTKELVFISHAVPAEDNIEQPVPAVFGPVEFKDDIDVVEQLRFRKRYQRKSSGDNDVIFLQDIKDVVLYTAPLSILNASVIKVLHLATTERFIRALLLYCQYYLQIAEEMSHRVLQLETKVRTPRSTQVEIEFRENLEDLRVLVAKEYSIMIMGGHDFKKFHHMGPCKKSRSLSKKEANLFESVLRICIQIIWLALGRRSFNQIELEIHRMFKSQTFNIIEHKLHTNYVSNMAPQERFVLLGHCAQNMTKLCTQSPLMNEIVCHRPIDFRLLGLGSIKFAKLTSRQRFLEQLLCASEKTFEQRGLTLGIIGMARSRFDTLLRENKIAASTSTSSASVRSKSHSRASRSSLRKSTADALGSKPYPDIVLPNTKFDKEWRSDSFPTESLFTTPCSKEQRHKWLTRLTRLTDHRIPLRRNREADLDIHTALSPRRVATAMQLNI